MVHSKLFLAYVFYLGIELTTMAQWIWDNFCSVNDNNLLTVFPGWGCVQSDSLASLHPVSTPSLAQQWAEGKKYLSSLKKIVFILTKGALNNFWNKNVNIFRGCVTVLCYTGFVCMSRAPGTKQTVVDILMRWTYGSGQETGLDSLLSQHRQG